MKEIRLSCRGIIKTYPAGTLWRRAAEDFTGQYPSDILLVHDLRRNRLIELQKEICEDTEAEFLCYQDAAGRMTYARSVLLLFLKAFYEVLGASEIEKVTVEFTVSGHFYMLPRCRKALTKEVIGAVREKMRALSSADLPICKKNITVDQAIASFERHHMYDKSKLFHYRRSSRVNVYSLDGFEDYFYGAMCDRTGLLRVFDLRAWQDGLILMLPDAGDPSRVAPFQPSAKLFQVQRESFAWAEQIGIDNIAELNGAICRGEANELILMQEAFFEKKIGEIAQRISAEQKKIILLAGPSSSGKTSTAHRLALQLRAYGLKPHIISADDYFVDLDRRKLLSDGQPDLESLAAVDTAQFNADMTRLLAGDTVELPKYNFVTGKREYRGNYMRLSEEDVMIIEGIHCLNEKFSEELPRERKFKIYVSALTQLNIDEHNRIPTTDCRLLRRMVRDSRTRGYSAQTTIARWQSVRDGEEANIFPYQDNADVQFNTAMIYELAVLKAYAEPLLFGIPRGAAEYLEAKRLLKFLDYVLPLSPEEIPHNSILREFIGGSCLDVG